MFIFISNNHYTTGILNFEYTGQSLAIIMQGIITVLVSIRIWSPPRVVSNQNKTILLNSKKTSLWKSGLIWLVGWLVFSDNSSAIDENLFLPIFFTDCKRWFGLVWWVLRHINLCRLFNAKSIFIQIVIFQTIQFSMTTQLNSLKHFYFK